MRIWFKIFKKNRMLKDIVILSEDETLTRTKKILEALDDACVNFDLCKPIWLDNNVYEFNNSNKTRFIKDNFIEEISFDFLEIQILEE